MEPRPLTTWEQKERDGLLALETDAWRQKRLVAEDPDTTADVLERLVEEIQTAQTSGPSGHFQPYDLLIDALVVHPNTPPKYFLNYPYYPGFAGNTALCHNPAAPFLCLEIPDFWNQMKGWDCVHFLANEALPANVARVFSQNSDEWIAQEALLHISLCGEIASRDEGEFLLTKYWRAFCCNPKPYISQQTKEVSFMTRHAVQEWDAELVRFGLAPVWAAPREPFQKRHVLRKTLCGPMFHLFHLENLLRYGFSTLYRPSLKGIIRQLVLVAVLESGGQAGEFAEFVTMLHGVHNPFDLQFITVRVGGNG